MNSTQIKSPLRYPGGKSKAIKHILPLIPTEFSEYREPFIGGGSVLLAVKQQFNDLFSSLNRFTISDLNHDLICFWTSVRDEVDVLCDAIEGYRDQFKGKGRDLYNHFSDLQPETDFQKAVRFFIMNRITFSGVMDAGGYSQQAFDKRFTMSSIKRVREAARMLMDVEIIHSDYAPVLQAAGKDVFIFLDPPYYSATESKLYGKRGYLHTSFDHQRFADAMRHCQHRWLITYDDSPYIRELFSFARIIEWELQYGMNNYKQEKAGKGKELFILNYSWIA
jgi:DNA adenine methylase